MTTRELAEQIARAVLSEVDDDQIALAPHDTYFNPAHQNEWGNSLDLAYVVLKTLEAHDSWFCRLTEDADGLTVETPYPRQQEQRRGMESDR